MRWWCTTTTQPWDWTPRPYFGVWVLVAALAIAYARAVRHDSSPRKRRRAVWFGLGLATLWAASDWPIGPLGAGYLAWVHMAQFMLFTMVAAPLLLLGTPEWLARSVLQRLRAYTLVRTVCQPVAAGVLFNVLLVATHAPFTVDRLRTTQTGSFVLDMAWLLMGFMLWVPVIGPLPELVVKSVPLRAAYLFLASSVFAMIPGGFVTFSETPLYAIYREAPRVGLSPLEDQQAAGVLMKVGNIPIVWTVITVIYLRWYNAQLREDRHRESQRRGRSAVNAVHP